MAKSKTDITFTPRLVEKVGQISDVLADFLDEQVARIQKEVKGLPGQAVQHLLAQFVTEEGTKKPVARADIEGALAKKQLDAVLGHLEDARILRQDEPNVYELAHDTLAQRIIEALDAKELEIRRAVRIVRDRHEVFEDTETYLKPREVQIVEMHEAAVKERLSEEEWAFLTDSRQNNKTRLRNRRIAVWAVILGLSFLSAVSIRSCINAENSERAAKDAKKDALKNLSLALNANANLEYEMNGNATQGYLFSKAALSQNETIESQRIFYKIVFQEGKKEQKWFYKTTDRDRDPTTSKWAAYAPDSKKVIAHYLWDPDAFLLKHCLQGDCQVDTLRPHDGHASWGGFSPDGKTIATASQLGWLYLWDQNGNKTDSSKIHSSGILHGSFSPDGALLVTAGRDSKAVIWFINKEKEPRLLEGHSGPVNRAAFSPDGRYIITASDDRTAILWDTAGARLAHFKQHAGPVKWAGFSPDGKKILTASEDNTAILWNFKEEVIGKFDRHSKPLNFAAFSSGGDSILTASTDNTVLLWDSKGNIRGKLYGHQGLVNWISISPDGKTIMTRSEDRTARTWASAEQAFPEFGRNDEPASFAIPGQPSNGLLLIIYKNSADLWQQAGSGALLKTGALAGHKGKINHAVFSPDGTQVLTVSDDNTGILWGVSKDTILQDAILTGHNGAVNHAAFTPEGDKIITASKDWTVRLWKKDGAFLKKLEPGFPCTNEFVQCSKDGKKILALAREIQTDKGNQYGKKKAVIWTQANEFSAPFNIIEGEGSPIDTAHFLPPEDTLIITTDRSHDIRLWNLNGECIDTLLGHSAPVTGVCFDAQGGFLSYSEDNTAIYWDKYRKVQARLVGHTAPVVAAEFSPKDTSGEKKILTLSDDSVINIWTEGGELLATHKEHEQAINSAHFAMYGKENALFILAALKDGTAKLIPVDWPTIDKLLSNKMDALSQKDQKEWGLLKPKENEGQEPWTDYLERKYSEIIEWLTGTGTDSSVPPSN